MVKGAETHFKPVLLAVQAGLGVGDLCISCSGLNPEWFTLYCRCVAVGGMTSPLLGYSQKQNNADGWLLWRFCLKG